jgi:hypothetical protein
MADTNKPKQPNTPNEREVTNPKAPGNVGRVDPATGGSAGTIDTDDVNR